MIPLAVDDLYIQANPVVRRARDDWLTDKSAHAVAAEVALNRDAPVSAKEGNQDKPTKMTGTSRPNFPCGSRTRAGPTTNFSCPNFSSRPAMPHGGAAANRTATVVAWLVSVTGRRLIPCCLQMYKESRCWMGMGHTSATSADDPAGRPCLVVLTSRIAT